MSSDVLPNSLSSSLMLGINLYRNKPAILNKVQAQIAYPFVAVAALVESVVASIFTILSICVAPLTRSYFDFSAKWLKSSSFTVIWSLANFFINPYALHLVLNEKSAKLIARNLKWRSIVATT